ncbi:hypothetical protein CASFOL_025603 [Castilleja foliolosa]|uniref:Uncharacterized protein n=1 Tax=Castilleja foliolosa TaxID=1961234 RepID=A0ABD3CTX0_9LAMI
MAEAVVSATVDTFKTLIVDEVKFCLGVESEVEAIRQQLLYMQSFLKNADSKQHGNQKVSTLVAQVRELAYEIEDNLVVLAAAKDASTRSRHIFKKVACWFKEIVTTYRVGSRISAIKTRIAGLSANLPEFGLESTSIDPSGEGTSQIREFRRSYSHVVDEDLVGLQVDIQLLVSHLIDGNNRVVSIAGMGGMGKTTMARQVYSHWDVRRHFDGFAWACVSQQWNKKDLIEGLLIKLLPEKREEIREMRDEELVRELHDVQVKKKCLVVLDDVWSGHVWESLKPAFPSMRTGAGSKLILTTRNREVVNCVTLSGFHYEPRLLSNEESWNLLRMKALPAELEIEPEIEKLGKEMVERCCGLPLAIIVLGGLLITKHTLREWVTIYESINWYLSKGGGLGQEQRSVTDVLAFSYHDLPYKLKQCFLCLANFPEDVKIDAEKLYQLWLAEGLILQHDKAERETMMDVGERYLSELAQRGMVQVKVKEYFGGSKKCSLHDMIRDLCITQAKKENFTSVVGLRQESDEPCSKTRRLYLGNTSSNNRPISCCSRENNSIRSAFIYANECEADLLQHMTSHIGSLRLLRVLDFYKLHFNDVLPENIGDLIHLRFLSLIGSLFTKLPSSLGKLIYLETLNLQVLNEIEIPNVIFKLKQLKHLYLPNEFVVTGGGKLRLDGLRELETLVDFCTSLCDVNDLYGLTNLRQIEVEIDGDFNNLLGIIQYMSFKHNHLRHSSLIISCSNFCSNEELTQLNTLLSCHRLYELGVVGNIAKLPEHHHFSSTIGKIAFTGSELHEDPMATLEKLPNLSSLTLEDFAYVGESMVCLAKGFPQLLDLEMCDLPNLKTWRIDEGAMPKLTRLVIDHCEKMEMLPDGLRFISTIKKLDVMMMHEDFKDRLRTTAAGTKGEDFYKVRHVAHIKID